MSVDRLTALDAAFLDVERPGVPINVGAVAVFEGGPLTDPSGRLRLDAIRAETEARLDALPRLRRRLGPPSAGLARPCWVDDAGFDITNHVDAVHLADPDGDALRRHAEALAADVLPRDRPLWHLRWVTGLRGGDVGLVQRVHHALVDGASGVDVAAALLDLTPDAEPHGASAWSPPPTAAAAATLEGTWSEVVGMARGAAAVAGALTHPRRAAVVAGELASALRAVADDGIVAPRSLLNGSVGPTRRLAWIRADVEGVKSAGREHGATANDVVLAAVAEGARHLLLHRHEVVGHDATLKVLVPVSQRDDTQRGTLGNRVSALLVPVPVGVADPVERLRAIVATTTRLKARHEASAGAALLGLGDLLPQPLVGSIARGVDRQPLVNLIVTNVPGSPVPLYCMGARLLEALPLVPVAGNLSLSVAVLSYDGALNLGVTADGERWPDVAVFAAGVERGFAALGAGRAALDRELLLT